MDEFEPHLEFQQLLKLEAKAKPKSSWKTSAIYQWLRSAHKTNIGVDEHSHSHSHSQSPPPLKTKHKTTTTRRRQRGYANVSGPINGGCTAQPPTSAVNQTKKSEEEHMPSYVSPSTTSTTRSFGPVYLVT